MAILKQSCKVRGHSIKMLSIEFDACLYAKEKVELSATIQLELGSPNP